MRRGVKGKKRKLQVSEKDMEQKQNSENDERGSNWLGKEKEVWIGIVKEDR